MCQFIEISNQMELNGKVSNFENKNLFNTLLYEIFVFKVPPTPPAIRVVLLHKQVDRVILYFLKCICACPPQTKNDIQELPTIQQNSMPSPLSLSLSGHRNDIL